MKAEVRSGIDRMETAEDLLRSGRIGLMTNQTGMDHFYRSSIDLLHERYHLTALFAVEHGIRGDLQAGAAVTAYRDGKTGLTVWTITLSCCEDCFPTKTVVKATSSPSCRTSCARILLLPLFKVNTT